MIAIEKTAKIVQRVDTCYADREFVEMFEKNIETLAGMVAECTRTNPSYLLSPHFRTMLAEKADLVIGMLGKVKGRIVVDNPGEPLR